MPPGPQTDLQANSRRLQALRRGLLAGLVVALAAPFQAHAQDEAASAAGPPQAAPATQQESPATAPREIAFEARTVSYDSSSDTVTAEGDVVLRSDDQSVRADAVSWHRMSGQIVATGGIVERRFRGVGTSRDREEHRERDSATHGTARVQARHHASRPPTPRSQTWQLE